MATSGIQMPGTYDVPDIPYGCGVFRTFPYAFMPLELLLGAWVWILVAATRVFYPIVQGWVMYVSVSSFFFSLLLLMVYLFGFHRNNCNTWRLIDVIYTGITAMFYLSAAVLQAYATIFCDYTISVSPPNIFGVFQCVRVYYHLDAAATVFAFLTSLIYMLHSFQSYVR
ncbi:MAL-like protein [Rana temporaria]|uniref:MAL-like protein n=1 Tax=Rana temporaria TaxID=8407 RepID=UPI001AAD449B|nr:MAL-like protein [Rana temporaria]